MSFSEGKKSILTLLENKYISLRLGTNQIDITCKLQCNTDALSDFTFNVMTISETAATCFSMFLSDVYNHIQYVSSKCSLAQLSFSQPQAQHRHCV